MTKRIFIYELPYKKRKSLCRILDTSDKWEELGGEHMGFDYTYLQYIRRKDSPTDELLTSWGNQNHTVNDLFVLLSKMQHYRAMTLIKDLVQEQYHHLLKDGEELMSHASANKTELDDEAVNRSTSLNQAHAVQRPPLSADKGQAMAALGTFEDSKDLGLDVMNLNLVEKPEAKTLSKTVKEVKIQNIPDSKEQKNKNLNEENNHSNGQSQAVYNSKVIPPVDSAVTQKPRQDRKLSNVSIASSVMEGCTPLISYEELEVATNGWDPTCILGKGGFGTVYKGTWKNTLVAVKKIECQKGQQMQTSEVNATFITQSSEIKHLNSHRHDNILSLYGYSIADDVFCLVYQFMANGSLEDRLHCRQNTRPLTWAQRLNIMMGTARGIQFLHSLGEKPLVHGDIKSANILLDSNFEPRLGDFGLAREGPAQHYTFVKVSRVHGTRPYLPDEFLRGKQFSVKVDTYSFGVVLFEVATGLRAYDENRKDKFLKDHVVSYPSGELSSLADPLAGPDYCASASGLITLGRNCVVTRPKNRPDMKNVLNDIDMLYNNYKLAENAISKAQQRCLTPTSPLQMQIMHDELRNQTPLLTMHGSPQPSSVPFQFNEPEKVWIFQGYPRYENKYPKELFPEAQRFAKEVGPVQILPHNQTGMPQPIVIHHPPPSVAVHPPSVPHIDLISSNQVDNLYSPPSHFNSSDMPVLTLLGNKIETGLVVPPDLPVCSSQESSHSSSGNQSESPDSIEGLSDKITHQSESEKSVHCDSICNSSYLPKIQDLLYTHSSNS